MKLRYRVHLTGGDAIYADKQTAFAQARNIANAAAACGNKGGINVTEEDADAGHPFEQHGGACLLCGRPPEHSVHIHLLPGMEDTAAAREQARAEEEGRQLTARLLSPRGSIESLAGEIEQRSPLFRETSANPFMGLF